MASTEKRMVRMLVQLPLEMKKALDFIREDEGIPQAAVMRRLLAADLKARREAGWVCGRGWGADAARRKPGKGGVS